MARLGLWLADWFFVMGFDLFCDMGCQMNEEDASCLDAVRLIGQAAKSAEPQPQADGDSFVYTYSFPETTVDLTINTDFFPQFFEEIKSRKSAMKMTQRGRFWFDKQFDCDVVMTDFEIHGENVTANYEGTNIKDLTDYRPLARFLRWILRR